MSVITFTTPPPASQVEWKTFNVTVNVTKTLVDPWVNGNLTVNLRYGGSIVWTETYHQSSGTAFSHTFTVGTRYFYSGASVVATFVPNIGTTISTSATLNITTAFREFAGGPYDRTGSQACRWSDEAITLTMRESSGGPVITTYGGGNTYSLTSSDGITQSGGPGIAFAAGVATFTIAMADENASATFTLTNGTYANDHYDSDPIDVINPDFIWANEADTDDEATAYDSINNASITTDNPFDPGNPPVNFPSTNWVVDSETAGDVTVTHGNFVSGVLNNIQINYGAVKLNVRLKLTYTPDPTFEVYSAYFDIITPSFVFSGGPFDRSVPRFFNNETASFTITAQNKYGSTVTGLPSSNWDITGLNPDLAGQTFTNGVANPTATFPAGAVGLYNFTVTRAGEVSLTDTSDSIPMAAQVNLDPPFVAGSSVTISGTASYDSAHTINVYIDIAGATPDSDTVATNNVNTGAFTDTFNSLSNDTYTVTVKEDEDPGTSTQNTDTFTVNVVVIPTEINVTFTDDADGASETVYDLDGMLSTDEAPIGIYTNRELEVAITTGSPGASAPGATLTKPDGTTTALTFTGLTATIDQTTINTNGIYIIEINDYLDGNGATTLGLVRRFVIAESPANQTLQLEGWGYYPREEADPSNCAEESGGLTVPSWSVAGGATVSTVLGSPLSITTNGTDSIKNYKRTYTYIFENDGEPAGTVGTASGYIEAGVSVTVTTAGDVISAKDQNGADTTFTTTGAGLILRNGPYSFALTLINVLTGSYTGRRLAVRLYDAANDVYIISSSVVDWSTSQIIRIEKSKNMGDQIFEVSCKPLNSSGAFGPILISTPAYRLPGDTTAVMESASVSFGVFENHNQNISSEWEFVRYAFFDEGYTLGAGEIFSIGYEQTQRTGEIDFYRSPMLTINGSATDQPVVGTNQVASIIYRDTPLRFNTIDIPIKVRYAIADWDDSAENVVDGFFKPGFVNYYETAGEFGALNAPLSASAMALPSGGGTTGNTAWSFTLAESRRARRLFIIGAVDAPLLPTPSVVKGVTTNDYLIDDGAGKSDFRCGVRQFLPDFYIRDHDTDDGSAPAGGSNSPDITLGIFLGDGAGYDPNDVPVDGWDVNSPRYPAGFARGETAVPDGSGTFWTYNDQKAGAGIKTVRNAWSDYDAVNSYFNRVWLRISNRGIVPGPAKIQTFYGDSQVRTDFVPDNARDDDWEQILGKPTLATDEKYEQDVFMIFGPQITNAADPDYQKYPMTRVEAIPALSGYSTPGGSKSYTLVEYKWRIEFGHTPPSGKTHGCLTGFINQPPDFTTNVDTARRWDDGPLEGTPDTLDPNVSIWPITQQANNVTVKNTNIVLGEDPALGGDDFNAALKTTIGNNDDPVNYKKSPVDYQMTFGKKNARHGLRLDGRPFKNGELVLRIERAITNNVKLTNFKEITEYEKMDKIVVRAEAEAIDHGIILPAEYTKWLKKQPYRFFILKRGSIGIIDNITPIFQKDEKGNIIYHNCNVYFRPDSGIKEGIYQIKIEQLVNKEVVGGYVTDISIIGKEKIKFIGDGRKMSAYRTKEELFDNKVLPYDRRIPFSGPGIAHVENYRINRKELFDLKKPEDENELANIDNILLQGGNTEGKIDKLINTPYSITGKVIGQDKKPVSNVYVRLYDQDKNYDDFLGASMTDKDGYYSIVYTEKDFRDNSGKDTQPDLYIVVVDYNGKELGKTKTIHNADMQLIKDIFITEKITDKEKGYKVFGIITSKKNKETSNILIRAFDGDKKSADDFLGESWTDAEGNFEIVFDESAFKDKGKTEDADGLPDVYLNIYTKDVSSMKLIGRTKTRCDSKGKEKYLIEIE